MKKGKLVGVRIIGILIILVSVFTLFAEMNYHEATQLIKLPTSLNTLLYFTDIFINLVLIGCGILIIRLKELGRKIAVILVSISIIVSVLILPFMDFVKMREIGLNEIQKGNQLLITQGIQPITNIEAASRMTFYTSMGLILFIILLYIVCVFFLTRTKVKALFSPERGEAESKEAV